MALPSIDSSRAPDQLIVDMLAYINEAEAMVKAGDALSLAGFDSVVDALCKRIVALDVNEGKKYADKLEDVMLRLDQLQKNMTTLQNEVAANIKSLTSTKKAAKAYNSAPTGKVEE